MGVERAPRQARDPRDRAVMFQAVMFQAVMFQAVMIPAVMFDAVTFGGVIFRVLIFPNWGMESSRDRLGSRSGTDRPRERHQPTKTPDENC